MPALWGSAMDTGNALLDAYFRSEFSAYTGQWIHKHPDLDKVKALYEKFYKGRNLPNNWDFIV